MPIILKQMLSAGSQADGKDTRQIKDALNRLGYYTPYETAGITQYPDAPLFAAIKKFQKDNNLPVTGIIKPDDNTLSAVNKAVESAPDGYYIWRSVKDTKARPKHAALDGTLRKWGEEPYPGSEPNCRCWAEPVTVTDDVKKSLEVVNDELSDFIKRERKLSAYFLQHYLSRTGTTVSLPPNTFDKSQIVTEATSTNRKRFENEFLGKLSPEKNIGFCDRIKVLKDGSSIVLIDEWDVDVVDPILSFTPDRDFANSIGSGKIKSEGSFTVTRKGRQLVIKGYIVHSIRDRYDFNNDKLVDMLAFPQERFLAEKGFAKPFDVIWEKQEKVTGTGIIENGEIKNIIFGWDKDK